MTALIPYPAYQESGLPWVGRCPAHWELIPNRALVRKRKQLVGEKHSNYRLLSLTKQGVIVRDISTGKGKFSVDMGTSQQVRPGDIVFCLFDVPETPRTVGLSRHDGMITGAYTVFQCMNHQVAEYFELYYLAMDDRKLLSPLYSGLRNTIPFERLMGTKTPQPPLEEQAAIVQFIRHIDHRVNRLVKAKRRLIELLNEQKQAIIHRAVTRGLDPDVALKPSGIEWLGDIPAHWEVIGLLLRYSVELGKMLDSKRITGDFLVPYLRNTDVQWDRIRTNELPMMDIRPNEYDRYTVRKGDLLVCEGGDVGRSAIWDKTELAVGFQKALHRLRPLSSDKDNARFLLHVLFYVAKKGIFKADGSENTIAHLTSEKLRKYRFAFPGRAEQDELVSHIDKESSDINTVIAKAEAEIGLIREYRTRLVADVVTGQLDVRGVELPEMDEGVEEAVEVDEEDEGEDVDLEGDGH